MPDTEAQNRKGFGRWFRDLRIAKRIDSAAALGRDSELSPSHIAMIERGDVLPRWSTAKKLADALGLNPAERAEFYRRIEAARRPADAAALLGDGEAVPS